LTDIRETYRLFTCHLTHWSPEHLAWDLGVFVVLGTICERMSRPRFIVCLISAAVVIVLSIAVLQPGLYRGLSGIDSALLAWLAVSLLRRDHGWPRWFAAALLAAFLAKSGCELTMGRSLFVDSHAGGFVPAPVAHLAGAAVGAVSGMGPFPSPSTVRTWNSPRARYN
jgi:rhomboid family GlyGly-CTERM serine protease